MPQPTRRIDHPNISSVFVDTRKPTRGELLGVSHKKQNLMIPVAVRGLDGKMAINPDTSQPYTRLVASFTTIESGIMDQEPAITGWGGITDEAGAPIAFSKAHLGVLWEERYDVTLDHCYECKGAPDAPQHDLTAPAVEGVKVHPALKVLAFGFFINLRMDDPKHFDPDPTTNEPA